MNIIICLKERSTITVHLHVFLLTAAKLGKKLTMRPQALLTVLSIPKTADFFGSAEGLKNLRQTRATMIYCLSKVVIWVKHGKNFQL